jgi:uncharacterized MnhB-related membrane protein
MKKCPYCHELIQDDAIKCRFCSEFLSKQEASRADAESPKPSQPPMASSMHSNISDNQARVVIFALLGGILALILYAVLSAQKLAFPYAAIVGAGLSAFIFVMAIKKIKINRKRYISLIAFTVPFLLASVIGYNTGYTRYSNHLKNEKQATAAAIERQKQKEDEAAKQQLELAYNQEHKEENYQNALSLLKNNKYQEARNLLQKVISIDDTYKDAQAMLERINTALTKAENDRISAQASKELTAAEGLLSSNECSDFDSAIRKSEAVLGMIPSSARATRVLLNAKIKRLLCFEGNNQIKMAIQILEYNPLKLYVSIMNVSKEVRHANPGYFTLVTVDNRSYGVSTETYGLSKYFDAVDLQPGTQTSGRIIFDTYSKPKKLVYEELLGSTISRGFPFD